MPRQRGEGVVWSPVLRSAIRSEKLAMVSGYGEALFFRLLLVCDDGGCYEADPALVMCGVFPHKFAAGKLTVEHVAKCLDELEAAGLISRYKALNGRTYLEIVDRFHLAHKDATQKYLYPPPLNDVSGRKRDANGTKSRRKRSMRTRTRTRTIRDNASALSCPAACQGDATGQQPLPDGAMEFPIAGESTPWVLLPERIEQYKVSFPGVDVEAQLRHAREWCLAAGSNRKTRKGMARFIANWLGRAQDRAGRGLRIEQTTAEQF